MSRGAIFNVTVRYELELKISNYLYLKISNRSKFNEKQRTLQYGSLQEVSYISDCIKARNRSIIVKLIKTTSNVTNRDTQK